MASYRKFENKKGTKWLAEVSVGCIRKSRRCDTKAEAIAWGRTCESALADAAENVERGGVVSGKKLRDALEIYRDTESPTHKGWRWEVLRINRFLRDEPMADVLFSELDNRHAEDYIDRRLSDGMVPDTVIREMALLKSVVRFAMGPRMKYIAHYPWGNITNTPARSPNRELLITEKQISQICDGTDFNRTRGAIVTAEHQMVAMFIISIETGMRQNELASVNYDQIDKENKVIYLRATDTKNGKPRTVPLSPVAMNLIDRRGEQSGTQLFSITSGSCSTMFTSMRKRLKIKPDPKTGLQIRYHDSRHLAVTRLAKIYDVLALQRIIGHSDVNQLRTYYNECPLELAKKLWK